MLVQNVNDCLFIGPNEMKLESAIKIIRQTANQDANMKDIALSCISYKKKEYRATELIRELLFQSEEDCNIGSFSINETIAPSIQYLGTALSRQKFSFDFIRSFQTEKDKLCRIMTDNKVHCIVIPTTLYVTPWPVREIVKYVRKITNAPIIVGGPLMYGTRQEESEPIFQSNMRLMGADYYIASPHGDDTLCRLVNAIVNKGNVNEVENVYYHSDGGYCLTFHSDDSYALEDHRVDFSLFGTRLGKVVTTRTSISCPFHCSFCEYPQRAGSYQTLSQNCIEKELIALCGVSGVECISFIDDTFNVPPERFKRLLRFLISMGSGMKWYSYFRCQYADEETVKLMKESGCEGVILGVESGSQTILDNMNKKVRAEDMQRGIELLNQYGILSIASFIVGFPGETEHTVAETIRFIQNSKPTFYKVWQWYYSKATPIHEQRERYGLSGQGLTWKHNAMDSAEALTHMDAIFQQVTNSLHSPFYFDDIIFLMHKGLTIGDIEEYIELFNKAILAQVYQIGQDSQAQHLLDAFAKKHISKSDADIKQCCL